MTVAEFSRLPKDDGPFYHELRHGEVVAVTRAKLKHHVIQARLRDFFKGLASPGSFVEYEVAFRPLPEHELWVADVAWVSAERYRTADPDDYIAGAPELVVEVLSPSNTSAEIHEKEQICLRNGTREFWVVDPVRRKIKISTPDGSTRMGKSGQEIPLPLFDDASIATDAIFG